MPEHSLHAPGFRVNKVKTSFQDAPDGLDYIALLKAIKLFFRNQPVHVFPCGVVHEQSVTGEPGKNFTLQLVAGICKSFGIVNMSRKTFSIDKV